MKVASVLVAAMLLTLLLAVATAYADQADYSFTHPGNQVPQTGQAPAMAPQPGLVPSQVGPGVGRGPTITVPQPGTVPQGITPSSNLPDGRLYVPEQTPSTVAPESGRGPAVVPQPSQVPNYQVPGQAPVYVTPQPGMVPSYQVPTYQQPRTSVPAVPGAGPAVCCPVSTYSTTDCCTVAPSTCGAFCASGQVAPGWPYNYCSQYWLRPDSNF